MSRSREDIEADERAWDEGKGAAMRLYYNHIRAAASEIRSALVSGELDPDLCCDRIHEAADSSYYVTYTHALLQCMIASANWNAVEAHGDVPGGSMCAILTGAAYWAVYQDIAEELGDPYEVVQKAKQ